MRTVGYPEDARQNLLFSHLNVLVNVDVNVPETEATGLWVRLGACSRGTFGNKAYNRFCRASLELHTINPLRITTVTLCNN